MQQAPNSEAQTAADGPPPLNILSFPPSTFVSASREPLPLSLDSVNSLYVCTQSTSYE